MKMSQDSYQDLERHIRNWIAGLSAPHYAALINQRATQTETRFIWDVMWASVPAGFIREQYNNGLNDNHIETALKRVFSYIDF